MRIRLALGGGGVRGFFHLGLLRALDEAGVRVTALAGSSAGALAAAAYAFGLPLRPEPILEATRDPELLRLAKSGKLQSGLLFLRSLRRPALADPERYRQGLTRLFGDARVEDARVPLRIAAADLATGELVVLDRGPVVDAVLASGSIPGIFPPKPLGSRLLVDGDVAEKVPVSAVADLGAGPLVAVDVSNPGPIAPPRNSLETVLAAGEASRRRLKELALDRADLVVRIPLEAPIDTFDLERAHEVYELGRREGERLLARLPRRRLFGWFGKAKQRKR